MDAGNPSLSLADYVTLNARCDTCSLEPGLLAEIRNARGVDVKRFSYSKIADWLALKGHNVSEDSLRRHFKNHEARA